MCPHKLFPHGQKKKKRFSRRDINLVAPSDDRASHQSPVSSGGSLLLSLSTFHLHLPLSNYNLLRFTLHLPSHPWSALAGSSDDRASQQSVVVRVSFRHLLPITFHLPLSTYHLPPSVSTFHLIFLQHWQVRSTHLSLSLALLLHPLNFFTHPLSSSLSLVHLSGLQPQRTWQFCFLHTALFRS